MRDLIRIVEGQGQVLYHGTCSAFLPDIEQHGLRAMVSKDNADRKGVYLTSDYGTAMDYGDLACTRAEDDALVERGQSGVVILEVPVSALDPAHLEPDDYELRDALQGGEQPGTHAVDGRLGGYSSWTDVPWEKSLEVTKQVLYTKDIPASLLRIVE